MSTYNFAALDDKEFESLAADLIGTLNGVRVERFKPGKDAGVDGRWFITDDDEAIIQCKHWMRSGYSALLRQLSKKEKSKIAKLNPSRYILVTSIELSRDNKKQIKSTLSPFIRSEDDIFGLEDVDGLLQRNPEIEKRHYKLWLSSAATLNHVFNSAIIGRSQFDAETISDKLPLFVKTEDFEKAAHLLRNLHTVIITGIPGIGKTTLAQQLIIGALAEGYELVSVRDITEAESVFNAEKKQVFYFDDFLGRNLLEALGGQHDTQVVGFIKRVYRDELKRFVLTSRSSILNQGKQLTDLFKLEKTNKNEYEVHIDGISRYTKARILYSHVWHSNLPPAFLDEIFAEKRYKKIADHSNFTPRLISFITDCDLVMATDAKDYWQTVTEMLANPKDVWEHPFEQMSQDCRDMTYLVVLNGKPILEDDLRTAFRRTRPDSREVGKVEHDALVALKVCAGSVLNRIVDSRTKRVTYDLYNPSIADYVYRVVPDWAVFAEFFASLRTCASLRNLRVMSSSKIISQDAYFQIIEKLASKNGEQPENDAYMIEVCDMILEHESVAARHDHLLRYRLNTIDAVSYDGQDDALLSAMCNGISRGIIEEADRLIGDLCERDIDPDHFPKLAEAVSLSSSELRKEFSDRAKHRIVSYWCEFVDDFIVEADLLRGVHHEGDFLDGRRELQSAIAVELQATGLDFESYQIREICDRVDMSDIAIRNIEWEARAQEEREYSPPRSQSQLDDEKIDDLFDRDRS